MNPIAIMSFSWMADPVPPAVTKWRIEQNALNYAQDAWLLPQTYWKGNAEQTLTLLVPYEGGSPEDPYPDKQAPKPEGPPDSTQNANHSRTGLNSLATAIADAVNASTGLNAGLGDLDAVGNYVSGFMAYHVAWYRETHSTPPNNCLFAGHTHVAEGVTPEQGAAAVITQLDVLVDNLP
jgi:hypothetical protein